MYYESISMSLEEAVREETSKGFDCTDEFREVMREIAYEYNVTIDKVLYVFYNQDMEMEA
jgi:hypothetical protein